MAAWQRCMARSETTLASKMSVFGHEQESVEVVVRDLIGSLLNVAGRASMVAEVRRDEQTTALPTGSGPARRLR